MSKKKTQELQGMPELDSAGKLAVRLSAIDDALDEKHKERNQTALELGSVLEMTGRMRIQLDDRVYVIKETKALRKIVAIKVKKVSGVNATTHASKSETD